MRASRSRAHRPRLRVGGGRHGRRSPLPVSWTRSTRRRAQAGAVCGKSARKCAPRLSSRASAAVATQARPVAGSAAAPAPERRATPAVRERLARGRRVRTTPSVSLGTGARRACASGAAGGPTGRAPAAARGASPTEAGHRAGQDEGLEQRVAGEAIGAVHAGAATSPQAQRPAIVLRPSSVHVDAAHVVVRRRARPGSARARGSSRRRGRPRTTRGKRSGKLRPPPRARRGRRAAGRDERRRRPARRRRAARARAAAVARQNRAPCSSTRIAPSPRSASVSSGMGSTPDVERRRVELHELHVGQARAGARGQREAVADGVRRIGGVRVEAAQAAGREHHGARRQQAGARTGLPPGRPQRRDRRPAGERASSPSIDGDRRRGRAPRRPARARSPRPVPSPAHARCGGARARPRGPGRAGRRASRSKPTP